MNIISYNSGRYFHVTQKPSLDFWYSSISNDYISPREIQQKQLVKDSIVFQCAVLCEGTPRGCCADSLVSNTDKCLVTNAGHCILHE